jgi:hypothetical protein
VSRNLHGSLNEFEVDEGTLVCLVYRIALLFSPEYDRFIYERVNTRILSTSTACTPRSTSLFALSDRVMTYSTPRVTI